MPEPRTIRLFTLGPPEVRMDDSGVKLSPKLLALLVYLAVASPRGVTRRDTLLATFWPDRDGSRARNALSQALHRLRKELGRRVIENRGQEELVLGGHVRSDVEGFSAHLDAESLDEALELYRGEFLEGFHLSGAPGFERWLDGVRARLRREAREAGLRLASSEERDGRTAEAAGRLRRALEIVPNDEAIARRLIRLHLDAGERAAALRAYRRLARRMDTTLGALPSEETRALLEEAGAVPEVPISAPDVISPPPPARRIACDLTERAEELMEAGAAENSAARELLTQAARFDPGYAPALATSARAIARWVERYGGAREEIAAALDVAQQALKADPELPSAHFARGYSLEVAGRLEDASRAYRTTLEIRGDHLEASAHLGRTLLLIGDFAAALRWSERVVREREPDAETLLDLGLIHHCLGEDDEGRQMYARSLAEAPEMRFAEGSRVYWDFVRERRDRSLRRAQRLAEKDPDGVVASFAAGDAHLVARDFAAAIPFYERCHRANPDTRQMGYMRSTRTALGYAHLRGGDADRGRQLLAEAERDNRAALATGVSYGGFHYDLAAVYAARGENERALDWLERSYRAGWLQHEFLEVDPLMDSVRGDDRYEDVMAAIQQNIRDQRERLS